MYHNTIKRGIISKGRYFLIPSPARVKKFEIPTQKAARKTGKADLVLTFDGFKTNIGNNIIAGLLVTLISAGAFSALSFLI